MIWFLGDNHGCFDHVLEAVDATGEVPAAVVFLGDLECQGPFHECVAPIEARGIRCWTIPGNHDSDSPENFRNLFDSPLFRERNLHGRVVEIDGVRIAGLGGVFRGEIWYPRPNPEAPSVYDSWEYYCNALELQRPPQLRGRPLQLGSREAKHRTSIFYDDWFRLYGQAADILVTHEAPDCHPHGFKAITALAQSMGVKFAFHGHQHDSLSYRAHDERLGFQAFGVGFCGITDMYGGRILPGDFDEGRKYRQGKV